jgi:dipeptidyl aminopeptidase/acylaminoacyl peptidase
MAVTTGVRRALAAAMAAALSTACTRTAPPAGAGRRIAEGHVLALRASADGTQLAFLHRCEPVKDRTLPPGTASCELAVVPAAGGAATRVATGVSTMPYGFGWSATGHALAALAAYDHAEGRGTLVTWSGGEPRRLAEEVTFYGLDRLGTRAGWVGRGRLFVAALPGGEPLPVVGAEGVATFQFGGRDGVALLARRSARIGGELLAVQGAAPAAPVAGGVREYGFSRDGGRFAYTSGAAQALAVAAIDAPRGGPSLGRDVQTFVFSPRGDAIAFVADAAPGRQGDLWVAPLSGGAATLLARRVGEPRWSRDGSRLAWLQEYDPRSRTGALAVGAPGARAAALARNVSDFDLTPDGAWVAYLVHETAGGYSVDLGLAAARGDAPPSRVAKGVFGFSFSPDGRWLYYRAACVREAEACDLLRVATGAAPGGAPERVAEGVKSFEFAPGRPDRLLLGWSRKDRVALDLAVWEAGKATAVDTVARPGTAQFLGGDARRLAYVVVDPKRPGVYVAEVP